MKGREEREVEGRQHHSPRRQWVSTPCTELPLPPACSPSPRSPLSRGSQWLGSKSSVSKGTRRCSRTAALLHRVYTREAWSNRRCNQPVAVVTVQCSGIGGCPSRGASAAPTAHGTKKRGQTGAGKKLIPLLPPKLKPNQPLQHPHVCRLASGPGEHPASRNKEPGWGTQSSSLLLTGPGGRGAWAPCCPSHR